MVDDASRRRAINATGTLLTELLQTNPQYDRTWRGAGRRLRSSATAPAAVSQVIASYLWEVGERPDTETDLPRSLRDRIRRALRGEQLSGETLTWFIGAFEMSDQDAQKLWATFSGDAIGPLDAIVDTVPVPRPMGKRQWHRTMTLFERYLFSKDRSYIQRRTMQVIQAIEDGVDSYLFNHEPFAASISVLYGGHLGQHYEYGGGLVSDDIMFGRTLQTGQRIAIEYETAFDPGVHRPTEVRRAVRARVENLDFAIQFAAEHAPRSVWFCAWPDHYTGDPVLNEPLSLDEAGGAHRFVAYAQQTVLGFRWEW
ncbi:hypothetical protein ACFOWZ_07325 [Lentzea rhizosphaerae]|uniref:Uncharacterized protein n=1 Tax=Lentzea rhizosphaerae TaxID=2041025 RepID=A0ABV8BQF9_9PSEU